MHHYPSDTRKFGRAKLRNNVKKLTCFLFTFSLLLITLTSAGPKKEAYRIKTVVIDAGHGGHDTGCLGSSSREKHVALEIALKLGRLIEQNYPDIKVVYTRKTDVFIPLHERADIANRNKADLFICIHLNSGSKAAYGAETFVMGLHKSEDNLNVAKRENASILLEEDYQKQYDGFDPNSPEANIIFSLYQNQFLNQSLMFASNIQNEFEEYAGRNNRGVKQAGFLVLYRTAMPAVLIECGFLTHDLEEKYLASEKGQSTIATSIYRAFKGYKLDMETPGTSPEIAEKNTIPANRDSNPVKKEPIPVIDPLKPDPKKSNPESGVKEVPVPEKKPVPPPEKPDDLPAVYYTVQIGASKNPEVDGERFNKIKDARGIHNADGYTRYVVGAFTTLPAAREKQTQLIASGFKDAFITAYKGKEKITLPMAAELLKRQ